MIFMRSSELPPDHRDYMHPEVEAELERRMNDGYRWDDPSRVAHTERELREQMDRDLAVAEEHERRRRTASSTSASVGIRDSNPTS
jgi:hypothetical protein